MNTLMAEGAGRVPYFETYPRQVAQLLSSMDLGAADRIAEALIKARLAEQTIFCIGNGGSAATASHFATDLAWGRQVAGINRPRALSLAANVPLMTAVANDIGFAEVFVEQLKTLFRRGDVVFAISASGNSENLLRAIEYANGHGGVSVGLVGFDGGKMLSVCHSCLHVETPPGMYEMVEDVHHAVCHMLSSYMKPRTSQGRTV